MENELTLPFITKSTFFNYGLMANLCLHPFVNGETFHTICWCIPNSLKPTSLCFESLKEGCKKYEKARLEVSMDGDGDVDMKEMGEQMNDLVSLDSRDLSFWEGKDYFRSSFTYMDQLGQKRDSRLLHTLRNVKREV